MGRRRLIAALVLAVGTGALACAGPTEPESFDLGGEVTLARGQTAAARDGSLEIVFVEVLDDSRCPSDVTCVWAGEIRLRVSLKGRSGEPVARELREGESTAFEGRRIELVRVRPVPVSTRKIAPEDYRAAFKICDLSAS